MVTGAAAWLSRGASPYPSIPFQARDWVLLTAFENRTGDPELDGPFEHALGYELNASAFVNVVTPERVQPTLQLMLRPEDDRVDVATGREIALRDGQIRLVIAGSIDRVGQGYVVTIRAIEPHSNTVFASRRERAATSAAVGDTIRKLSGWIRVTLGEARTMVQASATRLDQVATPALAALELYAAAQSAGHQGRWPEVEALLSAALAEDPDFASAHTSMAWALRNQGRPLDASLAAAQRAVDLIERAAERERYSILGSLYWLTNQVDRAIGQFEALIRRYPDDYWGLRNLRELYKHKGHAESALEATVRIASLQPTDLAATVAAAQELLQSRGLEAARPLVAHARNLLEMTPRQIRERYSVSAVNTYVLLFPAHERWVEGRAQEASAAIDGAAARAEISADGDYARSIIGGLRLTLGQLRLAEQAYAAISRDDLRGLGLAQVALARQDAPSAS